jgi:hypothetical protein
MIRHGMSTWEGKHFAGRLSSAWHDECPQLIPPQGCVKARVKGKHVRGGTLGGKTLGGKTLGGNSLGEQVYGNNILPIDNEHSSIFHSHTRGILKPSPLEKVAFL